MKNFFLFLALALSALPAFCQQSSTDSLRTATNRAEQMRWNLYWNEFCIHAPNLLYGGSANTILYKRRYERGRFIRVKETRALRAIVSFDIDQSLNDAQPEFPLAASYQNDYNTVYIAVGREIQQNLGRFQLFYGLDVFGQWSKDVDRARFIYFEQNTGDIRGVRVETHTKTRTGGGAAGFVGMRFFCHPRVSLSLESGVSLGYQRTKSVSRRTDTYQNFEDRGEINKYGIFSRVMAQRFFTVNFHF